MLFCPMTIKIALISPCFHRESRLELSNRSMSNVTTYRIALKIFQLGRLRLHIINNTSRREFRINTGPILEHIERLAEHHELVTGVVEEEYLVYLVRA